MSIEHQEGAQSSEQQQEKYRQIISTRLQEIFGVDSAQQLIKKFTRGEIDEREKVIIRTAIQEDRPIKDVQIFRAEEVVEVDENKDRITKNLPVGTLKIEYGKRGDDVANLTVYVYELDGSIQLDVLGKRINYKKQSRLSKADLSELSDPIISKNDERGHRRSVPKTSPGSSSINN